MAAILIAQDNDDIREVLHRLFVHAGFSVLRALTGRVALNTVQNR